MIIRRLRFVAQVAAVCAVVWIGSRMLAPPGYAVTTQDPKTTPAANDDAPLLKDLLEGLDLGLGDSPEDSSTKSTQSPSEAPATPPKPLQGPSEDSGGSTRAVTLWEAYQAMLSADAQLAADDFGQATQEQQQRAIDLLDQLLDTGASDDPQSLQQDPSATQSDSPSGEGDQAGDAISASSSESNASQRSGEKPDAENEQQQDGSTSRQSEEEQGDQQDDSPEDVNAGNEERHPLQAAGEAVWGHLPERMRGRLRAESPTEYLPQYSKEISEYFRALAELPDGK